MYLTGEGSIGILRIKPDPKVPPEVPEIGIGAGSTTKKSGPGGVPVPTVACLHYGSRVEVGNKEGLIATQPQKAGDTVFIPSKTTK